MSFANTLTRPRGFTPKCLYEPGELLTPPVSRVYHRNPPPRLFETATMTSGRNQSHPPVPSRSSALCDVPFASVMKNTDGGSLSPRTRGLCSAGSTHSLRHNSPWIRISFLSSNFLVQVSEAMFSSEGPTTGTSSWASTSFLPMNMNAADEPKRLPPSQISVRLPSQRSPPEASSMVSSAHLIWLASRRISSRIRYEVMYSAIPRAHR